MQSLRFRGRCTGTLNHAPLTLQGQRLWLSTHGTASDPGEGGPGWYALPEWRLGGLYAPASECCSNSLAAFKWSEEAERSCLRQTASLRRGVLSCRKLASR